MTVQPDHTIQAATGAASLGHLFLRAAERYDRPALRYKRDGSWADISYPALGAAARAIARGLVALGIEPGDRVAILSGTRAEWTLADLRRPVRRRRRGADLPHQLPRGVPLRARALRRAGGLLRGRGQLAKIARVGARCPASST